MTKATHLDTPSLQTWFSLKSDFQALWTIWTKPRLKIRGIPGYCVWTSLQSTHLALVNIASSKKILSRMWCSTNCATCNILRLSLSSLRVSSCTSSRCGSFLCRPWNKNFHFYKSSFHREPLSELAWQFFPSSLFPVCLLHLHSLLVSRTDCRVQPVGFIWWEIVIDLTFWVETFFRRGRANMRQAKMTARKRQVRRTHLHRIQQLPFDKILIKNLTLQILHWLF